MAARGKELVKAIGFNRQTGTGVEAQTKTQLQTALAVGSLWSLRTGNFNPSIPKFNDEDDAPFYGKGHEFATQVFPTSQAIDGEDSSFLTSQNAAMAFAFGLGSVAETVVDTTAHQYVCTLLNRVTGGNNLPATTVLSQIRAGGAGEILDVLAPGCVVSSLGLDLSGGPGLKNSVMKIGWKGCGKFNGNSNVTAPAPYAETRLGSGSATAISFNGVNFLTDARFFSLSLSINNDVKDGFFPGSGSQSGRDIQGRMRIGDRTIGLSWIIEAKAGFQEFADFLAGTVGALQIKLVGPLIAGTSFHTVQIDAPSARHKVFEVTEGADGFVSASMNTQLLYPSSGEMITATVITDKAGICAEP